MSGVAMVGDKREREEASNDGASGGSGAGGVGVSGSGVGEEPECWEVVVVEEEEIVVVEDDEATSKNARGGTGNPLAVPLPLHLPPALPQAPAPNAMRSPEPKQYQVIIPGPPTPNFFLVTLRPPSESPASSHSTVVWPYFRVTRISWDRWRSAEWGRSR
jgi:hypothetical protein